MRYFGPTSNLSLVSAESARSEHPPMGPYLVPDSKLGEFFYHPELVAHLLSLYWSWQHQYFVILDKDVFMRDLTIGGKFASGTLSRNLVDV